MSTKSELKENVLASKLEGALGWFVNNRSTALTVAGFIAATFLVASVFILRRNETRELNATRLAQAQSFLSQGQFEQANQILDDLSKTSTDANFLAMVKYEQGLGALGSKDYDKAILSFQSAIDSTTDKDPIKPLALNNLAYTYEQLQKYDLAADIYSRFMTAHGDHFLAPKIQLSLGRALAMAGKIEESRKALQQLIDLYPTSTWAENARSFLDKNKTR